MRTICFACFVPWRKSAKVRRHNDRKLQNRCVNSQIVPLYWRIAAAREVAPLRAFLFPEVTFSAILVLLPCKTRCPMSAFRTSGDAARPPAPDRTTGLPPRHFLGSVGWLAPRGRTTEGE